MAAALQADADHADANGGDGGARQAEPDALRAHRPLPRDRGGRGRRSI